MTTVSDISNPYAGEINLLTKIGLSLYQESIKGLPEEKKLSFNPEKSTNFKNQMDKANTKYVWGLVCFKIPDSSGTNQDFLEEYLKLKLSDVIAQSNRTWNCGTNDYIILVKGTSFTKEMAHTRI